MLQAGKGFDEMVNTWMAIHEGNEHTRPDIDRKNNDSIKHNTIHDDNTTQ